MEEKDELLSDMSVRTSTHIITNNDAHERTAKRWMDAFAPEFYFFCYTVWWTSTQFFVSGGVEIPLVIDPWPRRSAGVVRERTFEVLLWKRQADRQAGEVDLHIVSGRGYIPPFTESNI